MRGLDKIHYKNGNTILIGVVVVLSLIILFIAGGALAGMTLLTIKNRTGELNPSSVNFGGICGGTTAPATTQEFKSGSQTFYIPEGGVGLISQEDHIASKGEGQPSDVKDGIKGHLNITSFESNCPSSHPLCNIDNQTWTPPENGSIGRGSTEIPSAEHSTWIMNSRWYSNNDPETGIKVNPPAGTRVIITANKNGKSIVAVAGYEWGPTKDQVIGAQNEVLANLAVNHNDKITFGFAVDQTLASGVVYGADCISSGAVGTDYRSIGPGFNGYAGKWQNVDQVMSALGGQNQIKRDIVTVKFMDIKVSIHKSIINNLKNVESDIIASGTKYTIRQKDTGAFHIRQNTNNLSVLSPHSTGLAIDVNWETNGNVRRSSLSNTTARDPNACTKDIPQEVSDAFEKNGFFWGAKFRNVCDPMHFQYGGNWD